MEKLFGDSAVMIEPMFRVTPEAFDAIDMVSPSGPALVLSHDDMASSKPQGGVGVPVVGIVKTARFRMSADQLFDDPVLSPGDRECPNDPVPLQDAQNDELSRSSPSPFSGPFAPKRRLIALYLAPERLRALLLYTQYLAYYPEKLLRRRTRRGASKSQPVCRHSPHETLKKFFLRLIRYAKRIPDTSIGVSRTALATLESTVSQCPCPTMFALRT